MVPYNQFEGSRRPRELHLYADTSETKWAWRICLSILSKRTLPRVDGVRPPQVSKDLHYFLSPCDMAVEGSKKDSSQFTHEETEAWDLSKIHG